MIPFFPIKAKVDQPNLTTTSEINTSVGGTQQDEEEDTPTKQQKKKKLRCPICREKLVIIRMLYNEFF